MKSTIYKAYFNFETEEKWLNEMAGKGLALTDYTPFRYVFEECEPGEYAYRIELLEYLPAHPVSQKYISFLEESGIQHIASYGRWAYFRAKKAEREFDIYSDIDSRLAHYRRIHLLWLCLAVAQFLFVFANFSMTLNLMAQNQPYHVNLFAACFCLAVGILLAVLDSNVRRKINLLKKERQINE